LRGDETEEAEDGSAASAAEEQKARAEATEAQAAPPTNQDLAPTTIAAAAEPVAANAPAIASPRGDDAEAAPPAAFSAFEPVLLDRLPVGVLLHQHDTLLYANRRFLEWTGHENLATLAAAGAHGCPQHITYLEAGVVGLIQGVTELFYDLNWDPQVGSPSVEPQAAAARAEKILDQLAPR